MPKELKDLGGFGLCSPLFEETLLLSTEAIIHHIDQN